MITTEGLMAEIERLQAESNISDGLLADAKAEIERLQAAPLTEDIQPLYDQIDQMRAEIERLNKVNTVLCNCYANIKTEMDRLKAELEGKPCT